jgi:SHS2 domain-containing protein
MKFKFLEHTADIKFAAYGKSAEEAFENSSLALKSAISGKIKVREERIETINAKGKDWESLLYSFLEEILYMLDAENFLFSKIKEIKINKLNFKLKAVITGDDATKYKFTNNVKAVTYNEMFVKKEKGAWKIQAVLDV